MAVFDEKAVAVKKGYFDGVDQILMLCFGMLLLRVVGISVVLNGNVIPVLYILPIFCH